MRHRPRWLRLALLAYPADFRARFGEDLLRSAERRRFDVYRGSRLRMLADLLRNGIATRWDEIRDPGRLRSSGARPSRIPDRGTQPMDSIARDLLFSLRTLRKNPGFTAIAVLSLAFGIGANTAIFGIVDAVLLRLLPVRAPEELSALHWVTGPEGWMNVRTRGWMLDAEDGRAESSSFSWPQVVAFGERAGDLADYTAFADLDQVNLDVSGQSSLAEGQAVSGNYYATLGVRPALGRVLGPEDDRPGADPAVVLSHRFWTARFGADPSAVGSQVRINGLPFTVVGVSAAGFSGTLQVGSQPGLTLPLAHQARVIGGDDHLARDDYLWLNVLARRARGVDAAALEPRLDAIFRGAIAEAVPGIEEGRMPTLRLVDGAQGMTERRGLVADGLTNLMWVVGLTLLIACANLANLLLARSSTRRREIAVRLSLGASRGRLIRQLLTESLVLAALGGVAGVLLAHYGRGLFLGLTSLSAGMEVDVAIDARVLAFTGAVTLTTGLAFGIVPALRATRVDLTPALRGAGVRAGESHRGLLASKTLITVQVAMSVLLLVVAGLFVRNLQGLVASAENFEPDNVLVFRVAPSLNHYEADEMVAFYRSAIERVRALPGVLSATLTNHPPVSGTVTSTGVTVEGYTPEEGERTAVYLNVVGADFFDTFTIPLRVGRTLGPADMSAEPRVAVVSEEFVRRFLPERNPIGARFRWSSQEDGPSIEIVGVVANVAYQTLDDQTWAAVHVPFPQRTGPLGGMYFGVRTAMEPTALVSQLADIIADLDPDLPVYDVRTLVEQRDHTLHSERQFARIASLAGALAIVLASIGLYGVLSYAVVRRRREIGVRMALGAASRDVLRLVGQELRPVLVGVALGLVATWWGARLVASQLHDVGTYDPYAIVGAVLILLVVASAAAWLPARRAAALDPVRALREE